MHSNSYIGNDVYTFYTEFFQHPLSFERNASVEINAVAMATVETADATAEESATEEPRLTAMPVESETLDLKMSAE